MERRARGGGGGGKIAGLDMFVMFRSWHHGCISRWCTSDHQVGLQKTSLSRQPSFLSGTGGERRSRFSPVGFCPTHFIRWVMHKPISSRSRLLCHCISACRNPTSYQSFFLSAIEHFTFTYVETHTHSVCLFLWACMCLHVFREERFFLSSVYKEEFFH